MQPAQRLWGWLCVVVLVAVGIAPGGAIAAQQKWASQYVHWKSDGQVGEVLNVDQQVWVAKSNDGSYWPMQFGFSGLKHGGYMGLQRKNADDQNVRFSIWNATAAEGESCRTFANEGEGYTCVLPVKIESGKLYRLRLRRLEAVHDGQWWGGWLIEAGRNGALVEHRIGRIKAPAAAKSVNPNGIKNFVEYYGASVPACERVPLSIVGFFPPMMNYNGKGSGTYKGATSYASSKPPAGNICSTGKEDKGAAITATPRSFGSADGVLMFIGGKPGQHVLDARTSPMPAALPFD
jgi:uncharacterized protein DUF3472